MTPKKPHQLSNFKPVLSSFVHLIVTKSVMAVKRAEDKDLRSDVLRESLFLTVLHCKHTTGHASFGAACQATGIPSLFFFPPLSLFLF